MECEVINFITILKDGKEIGKIEFDGWDEEENAHFTLNGAIKSAKGGETEDSLIIELE